MAINKIYISGKISGMEERAKELFRAAEIKLIQNGYAPVNPMSLPHNHDKEWSSFMKEDITALMDCDSIYLLTNWHESKGAKIEFDLAIELGLNLLFEQR